MRLSRVLLTVGFVALFLLLLSALVVTTAPGETPLEEPAGPARLNAQFLPMALPAPDAGAASSVRPHLPKPIAVLLCAFVALVLPTWLKRDANGRVLNAKRYEDSFYQVFRQEVAGG